jgi:hypothetical protein
MWIRIPSIKVLHSFLSAVRDGTAEVSIIFSVLNVSPNQEEKRREGRRREEKGGEEKRRDEKRREGRRREERGGEEKGGKCNCDWGREGRRGSRGECRERSSTGRDEGKERRKTVRGKKRKGRRALCAVNQCCVVWWSGVEGKGKRRKKQEGKSDGHLREHRTTSVYLCE